MSPPVAKCTILVQYRQYTRAMLGGPGDNGAAGAFAHPWAGLQLGLGPWRTDGLRGDEPPEVCAAMYFKDVCGQYGIVYDATINPLGVMQLVSDDQFYSGLDAASPWLPPKAFTNDDQGASGVFAVLGVSGEGELRIDTSVMRGGTAARLSRSGPAPGELPESRRIVLGRV